MNADQAALARKQLDRRLGPLRATPLTVPQKGWVKAIRESLGMTTRQLAARMGVPYSRVTAIEQAELTGSTSVKTLRHAAAAMNCAFVYAFMPLEPLDEIVRKRAIEKARKDLSRLDHTMRLENQPLLEADLNDEEQRSIDRVLTGSLRGLWDEDRD